MYWRLLPSHPCPHLPKDNRDPRLVVVVPSVDCHCVQTEYMTAPRYTHTRVVPLCQLASSPSHICALQKDTNGTKHVTMKCHGMPRGANLALAGSSSVPLSLLPVGAHVAAACASRSSQGKTPYGGSPPSSEFAARSGRPRGMGREKTPGGWASVPPLAFTDDAISVQSAGWPLVTDDHAAAGFLSFSASAPLTPARVMDTQDPLLLFPNIG
ncbi:hypothetical protein LZ30DRAFT_331021 [Colletotrichum cereale]|nr:hypothetical protein LZ30DRAFT_331021 [Colletotrichum cereale]